jgi:hypothetical protein
MGAAEQPTPSPRGVPTIAHYSRQSRSRTGRKERKWAEQSLAISGHFFAAKKHYDGPASDILPARMKFDD